MISYNMVGYTMKIHSVFQSNFTTYLVAVNFQLILDWPNEDDNFQVMQNKS